MGENILIFYGIAEVVPLLATVFSFVYGIKNFFKKGKPLFLQSITMAMGCHALGSIYHLCQTLALGTVLQGFTPAYLGRIGFFLFFLTASYGQMDRIVDDGSPRLKPARFIALIAPALAIVSYLPTALMKELPLATKIALALVWIPAIVAVYYNMKHSLMPDSDFGFIKAIKPFNIMATSLEFAELSCLLAWDFLDPVALTVTAFVFAAFCIATMITAKKGAEKWTI